MGDRDQHRVLNAGKPDELAVAPADPFVQCEETKQIMHQLCTSSRNLRSLPLTISSGREIVNGAAL